MTYFLLEMGVEEMPSAYLGRLREDLLAAVESRLRARRLAGSALQAAGTPRRLAVFGGVAERQGAERRRVKGPPFERARLADGTWTAAAEGFARRLGLPVDRLQAGTGPEAGYVVATVDEPELPAAELLPGILEEAMGSLNPPRSMRWAMDDTRFVRPVRWLVALLDDRVLPVSAFGLQAGRASFGNRTDAPEPFDIPEAGAYEALMREHHVEIHHAERVRTILDRGMALAREAGGELAEYPGLLDEVADLVEWPVPFRGSFTPRALELPPEIPETAMAHHQRYFPVVAAEGRLQNSFIGVRNGEGLDLSGVIRGNEKVLAARLEDARFFFDEDRAVALRDRVDDLDRVVFHAALGTLGDKRRRTEVLARRLGDPLGLDAEEVRDLVRAATLAKTDLLTHVVGEFPELQGTMGGVYAVIQGETSAVGAALRGQYHPAGPDDALPESRVAQAFALVDRLDTLAGMQVKGLRPTGSEDPFGFRRQGLGVARLLMEGDLPPVAITELVSEALSVWGSPGVDQEEALLEFLRARVKGYLGARARADLVDAVLYAPAPWATLTARLDELSRRIAGGDFETMAVTFKRVKNLAADTPAEVMARYPDPAEEALFRALSEALRAGAGENAHSSHYWDRVQALYEPVAHFFDAVLVMDPDPDVQKRRLGLLAAVGEFLSRGADLARITGERGKA